MRKNKIEIQAILMLLFTLAVVLVLLSQMNRIMPGNQDTPDLPDSQPVGIVDSVYINKPFLFSVCAPNIFWTFHILEADSLSQNRPLQMSLPAVQWLVELQRHQDNRLIARSNVGIWQADSTIDAVSVAIEIFSDIVNTFDIGQQRVRILQQITEPAHHILSGAYFAVVLPRHAEQQLPVWVISVLPRQHSAYIIWSQTNEQQYTAIHSELERLVSGFRPMSSLQPY